jgi:prolyl-tRNA editing enzyme YbaK/EbsC (Cys-tRNA(Pro) deacylase)
MAKKRYSTELRFMVTPEQKQTVYEVAESLGLTESDILRMLVVLLKDKGKSIFN